ncbi:set domain-containing protein 5 [Moniliophthora roreri]|nr:set domain-containing protein 5 [Moniliophthora roreri]
MPPRRRNVKGNSANSDEAGLSETPKTSKSTASGKCSLLSAIAIALLLAIGTLYLKRNHSEGISGNVYDAVAERDASIFRVEDIPGKGKGVIATRDIELIIYERPLFVVPTQISMSPVALISSNLQRMDARDREAFFNLSYVNLPPGIDPEVDTGEVALAIFQTNAVAAGNGAVGIFPRMARLNHGCSRAFNVVYTWRDHEGALVIHAFKHIRKGQELLTTYTNTKQPRDRRRAYLLSQYGFNCQCDVCSLPEAESQLSDQRLSDIGDLYARFSMWGDKGISGIDAIDIAKKIWILGDEEGYLSERGQLAADAVWVAAAHSDAPAAQEWASLAVKWYSYEVGLDSPQVEDLKRYITNPRSHRAWGTREEMRVGVPGVLS